MRIAEFFQEANGQLSSARLIPIVWSLGVLLVWAGVSLLKASLLDIPDSVVVMVLGLAGFKVGQKWFEEKPTQTTFAPP